MSRSAPIVDTSRSPFAAFRPISVYDYTLTDGFLEPRRAINRNTTLRSQYEHCESTGRVDNFRRVAGVVDKPFQGLFFNDSDVYKWLEAAAWEAGHNADPTLGEAIDEVIKQIAAAQHADGYLNTYFSLERAGERWSDMKEKHELYCAGHLIQAAVAHHRATRSDRLLNVARRLADCIDGVFGPADTGKRPAACGHPELEMALIELARVTDDDRYAKLGSFMVDARGHGQMGGEEMYQDKIPYRDERRMVGHAVRHVYLNCGAADAVLEYGDKTVRTALDAQWEAMTKRQSYVTGGIGSRWHGEAFGRDYELPNERAYAETCAAIGSFMWNWRMLLLTGHSRYADVMEWTLYNAVLPGLSLDGQHYFYQNALADDGTRRRQAWFGCACCPPNVARLLAQLPGYFVTTSDDTLSLHLYAAGKAAVVLADGQHVAFDVRSNYPWDGRVAVAITLGGEFAMKLRIPGWCESSPTLQVNGQPVDVAVSADGYATINRAWRIGDVVELDLPMTSRRITSHPYVAENVGWVALARGPLLYCLEQVDNVATVDLRRVVLPDASDLTVEDRPDLLGGIKTLRATAEIELLPDERPLYATASSEAKGSKSREIVAVPYYAWANRTPGRMQVWIRNR